MNIGPEYNAEDKDNAGGYIIVTLSSIKRGKTKAASSFF